MVLLLLQISYASGMKGNIQEIVMKSWLSALMQNNKVGNQDEGYQRY